MNCQNIEIISKNYIIIININEEKLMFISKLIKKIFIILLFITIIIGLYISTAFFLTLFPTKNFSATEKKEKIYILYNNMHSDIVLSLEDISDPWIRNLPIIKEKREGYISFGWGDKETYLNTPTWSKIKASRSLKALFLNTPSLMHVSYYPTINYFPKIKTVALSKNQKETLKKTIFKSFDFKEKSFRGYGISDVFYSSPYQYNFVYTCNTWTGNTLRAANISVSYWTPFSYNVVHSLP